MYRPQISVRQLGDLNYGGPAMWLSPGWRQAVCFVSGATRARSSLHEPLFHYGTPFAQCPLRRLQLGR